MKGKPHLLRSVIILSGFYWAASVVWFAFTPPEGVLNLLNAIPDRLVRATGVEVPALEQINLFNLGHVQWMVLRSWVPPVLMAWLLAGGLGWGIASFFVGKTSQERAQRVEVGPDYRGIGVSIGTVIPPPQLKRVAVPAPSLKGLKATPQQLRLLQEIFEILEAYPDAFVGAGHAVSLVQHTKNVLAKAAKLRVKNHQDGWDPAPANLLIVAAAHDLGKITAYKAVRPKESSGLSRWWGYVTHKRADGEATRWVQIRPRHGDESARILASMDSWLALPEHDREAIRLAVKYEHNIDECPLTSHGDAARKLIQGLKRADGSATSEEKRAVLAAEDLPPLCVEQLLRYMPSFNYQNKESKKGEVTDGFRKGKRYYFNEIRLREVLTPTLSADINAALGGAFRASETLAPFTYYLLKGLDQRGWLVKKLTITQGESTKEHSLDFQRALWTLFSGKVEFKGFVLVDFPDDVISGLTTPQTPYPITMHGPTEVKKQPGAEKIVEYRGAQPAARQGGGDQGRGHKNQKGGGSETRRVSSSFAELAVTSDKPKAKGFQHGARKPQQSPNVSH